MKNQQQILNLLDEIIIYNEFLDAKHKNEQKGRNVLVLGDSWNLFHLRSLRQLIAEAGE